MFPRRVFQSTYFPKMLPSPYAPQSPCSAAPLLRSPHVPQPLCYSDPMSMFHSPFVTQTRCPCSAAPLLHSPDVPPKSFQAHMFPKNVTQSLCSAVPMFHRPFVPQSRCSPELFFNPYVPQRCPIPSPHDRQSLCSPVPLFRRIVCLSLHSQRCSPVFMFPRLHVFWSFSSPVPVFTKSPVTISIVPIFTRSVSQSLCFPNVFPSPYNPRKIETGKHLWRRSGMGNRKSYGVIVWKSSSGTYIVNGHEDISQCGPCAIPYDMMPCHSYPTSLVCLAK